MTKKKVFIVIPAYNEEKHIASVLQNIQKAGYRNIIVVDDGSKDSTKEVAEQHGAYVVKHPINRGPGAATQTGFDAAILLGADIVVTMDGDGQFNPENLPTIIKPLEQEVCEVVIGSRFLQKNRIPIVRRLYNFIASIVTYFLAGMHVSDSQSGFKAFSKKALEEIYIHTNGYEFCTEVIREIAFHNINYKEVPIDVYYTKDSMSKGQSFAGGLKTVFKLIVRSLMR